MDSTQILPKEVQFGPNPTMPQARNYVHALPAIDRSQFGDNGIMQFDIPRLQRSYLTKDTCLVFNISATYTQVITTNKLDNSVVLDTPGAYSFINKIEVFDYLGSTLLERLEDVEPFVALLMDTAKPDSPLDYTNEALGAYGTTLVPDQVQQYFSNGTSTVIPYRSQGPLSGVPFYHGTNGTGKCTRQFSLPLLSFLGLLSQKFVPLHNGFTLRITLGTAAKAFGIASTADAAGANSISNFSAVVDNPVLMLNILELGAEAEGLLQSTTGNGPLVFHTQAYRHYAKAFTPPGIAQGQSGSAFASSMTIPINLPVASLTGVFWFMRLQSTSPINGDLKYRNVSERVRNFLQRWSFQYGSSTLPSPGGIETRNAKNDSFNSHGAYALQELMKARKVKSCGIGLDSFNRDNPTLADCRLTNLTGITVTGSTYKSNGNAIGRFACGLNTQLDVPSTNVITGLNCNGMATSIIAQFDPTIVNIAISDAADIEQVQPVLADVYMEYDAFITVLPGVASSVSF